MVLRRCPQCGSTSDDTYGFCIKCGYEFPKIEVDKNTCQLCGYKNPDEADFCVKCGTPLVLKQNMENNGMVPPIIVKKPNGDTNVINPIVVKKEISPQSAEISTFEKILIFFGYVFSILGGILGLAIGIILSTRKNPRVRKHGHIQLAIFGFYVVIIAILFLTGHLDTSMLTNYTQLFNGNFTGI